jgi:CRISPR-associated endonuclease/helicase Cas3
MSDYFWGKSNAGGRPNLLLQHMFDAASVAELMWDSYVAPAVRDQLDVCCDGRGRKFFALVCGLHDLGKATPAFQCKDAGLAGRVVADGFPIGRLDAASRSWHHSAAGGWILFDETFSADSEEFAWEWVWPLIAGHHGRVPGFDRLKPRLRVDRGSAAWRSAQAGLIGKVAAAVGSSLTELAPVGTPSRGVQLALAGLVVMADWIASDEKHFVGVDRPEDVSIGRARGRARQAWTALRLRGGWRWSEPVVAGAVFGARFEQEPRNSQRDVIALAEAMDAPGLLLLEAPMGEGKTKTALAAAEVLAAKFGADGVFVGMPTQATSDPMFSIVTRWSAAIDKDVPVALLHGKRRFNREWRDIEARARYGSVGDDEFGCSDPYCDDGVESSSAAPAEWLFGRNRGLLTPVAVGVIDHLLFAGTRTKHVMLRHAGLAGKVVVLDEVHAYDVYMGQFLFEALRWLGDAKVPVIVLSATIPAHLRVGLVRAYVQGASGRRDVEPRLPVLTGYPSALAVSVARDGEVSVLARSSEPFRESLPVLVEVVQEKPEPVADRPGRGWSPDPVVDAVVDAVRDGGCVLVVRNVVARAQDTYQALKAAVKSEFGEDAEGTVQLLHGQLTMGQKVARIDTALEELGPPQEGRQRPLRRIIVATQIAEQSFDVDADLLVTDLAPIDLLLQRIGRLHRHTRPKEDRPPRLRQPRVLVAGLHWGTECPVFPAGSVAVYGRAALLRAAALVLSAGTGWSIPTDVPRLVADGYAGEPRTPQAWAVAVEEAEREQLVEDQKRRNAADRYLLAGEDGLGRTTLAGLHARSATVGDSEDDAFAVVRDGDPAVEVILLQRSAKGTWVTVDGTVDIGPNGDAVSDFEVLEKVAASMIRLPRSVGAAAASELKPLPGWEQDPWLRRVPALEIVHGAAELGGKRLSYDPELGLVTKPIQA